MFGDDKRSGGKPGINPNKECGDGYCDGRHTCQVWNVVISVMGIKNWMFHKTRSNICHYFDFRMGKKEVV